MSLLDALFFFLVFRPRAGLPQGVHGPGRPTGARPSPPPCGWSFGFITEPRTVGLIPMWRLRPALPMLIRLWSPFPIIPTVARQMIGTILISPDGRRSVAYLPSLAISWAPLPAERTICPPFPGWSSMLWTIVPTGISSNGKQLPTRISASGPFITFCPTLSPSGARMYAFSPSA